MKDLYTDEESKKMLNAIQRNYYRRKKKEKRAKYTYKIMKFVLIIMLAIILYLSFIALTKDRNSAIVSCIKKGNDISYCEEITG